jgi:hypothetical protein
MLGVFIRMLFVIAGFITSGFVSRNALNYDFIQMVVAMLVFTLMVAVIAFWPQLKAWFTKQRK